MDTRTLARVAGSFLLFLFLSLPAVGLPAAALSQDEPKRLIEIAPGKAFWMNHEQIRRISRERHEQGYCGGFIDITDNPRVQRRFLEPLIDFEKLNPTQQSKVEPMLQHLNAAALHERVKQLESFGVRSYNSETGVRSAQWIKEQFEKMAAGRPDITVHAIQHRFRQPSILARIQGRERRAAAPERVILGAHQDSIGGPGADDDASGTATLLEAFRVIVQSGYRPARSIEFIAYAGEEQGLLGSGEIAQQYASKNIPVLGVLQFDMTMYPGQTGKMHLIQDFVHKGLTTFVGKLITSYAKVPFEFTSCGYACSDHASWTRQGFAAAFPFEAPKGKYNPNIHTPRDTLDILNAAFGLGFVKVAVGYAVEMAEAREARFRP
jgi:bacterial leucyl aminopeptidase